MRKVIVNSTPLIVLCGIGKLNILKEMYEEIIIPSSVFREVTAKDDSACVQIKSAGAWVHVEQIKDHGEKKMYKAKLHDGEVEVMILAQERNADLVILDDNAAKKTAKYLGLTVTGTLGVLVKAKRQGIIEEVRSLLSEMRQNDFYVSKTVESMVLEPIAVSKFLDTLSETDRKILTMRMDDVTLEKIAEELGFKTHSAIHKRIRKIGLAYEKFSGEDLGFSNKKII